MNARHGLFTRLIEANLQELLEEQLHIEDAFLRTYAQILIYYLQSDVSALAELCREIELVETTTFTETNPERRFLRLISQLRLQIRRRHIEEALLKECLAFGAEEDAQIWSGEIHFVVALGYEILEDELQCREVNRKAYLLLQRQGGHRKALKALHNHVAAESRLHPDRKLFAEFHFIYTKAKKIGDRVSAGLALNNIAQEYLLLGAYLSALKYSNRALAYLSKDSGAIHYFLALSNRCQILIELGRIEEARIDFDRARISGFREIQATLAVLERMFQDKAPSGDLNESDLLQTWKTRLQGISTGESTKAARLTPKEDQLLELISKAPATKFQLMEGLFGTAILLEAAENRFKNLLSRLKKKRPGLVVFENDKYRINDEIFLKIS